MQKFYSNGKLLITGEYVVLDAALSLALPTKFGQSLNIETINEPKIVWNSFDEKGNVWFEDTFLIDKIASSLPPRNDVSQRIIQILNAIKTLNPAFLNSKNGFKISTHLTFSKNWGLGTSSTLINNIAQWAHINAFELLEKTFGGSGYDIACAQNSTPITYQLQKDNILINSVDFKPKFKNCLYFVYLNKKQNSRDGIANYKSNKGNIASSISEINDITTKTISCSNLKDFDALMTQHEIIISKIIKQQTVKSLLFNDFNGSIKSLGAWGGDFVLATSEENPTAYFKDKGFDVVIPYDDMILSN
ncbi:GYDIA family GHMP kinase [Mariniflexile litorale]|uniref:GYDIA family GHMP kinase n=1 Tax=Mariniflexile litorale TaxID=3045158 RepID=A0AAU7EBE2_9FLAO|nr:GYDIA family GHMP kinase [Mariniflexile sp. KMM 9835]MDQ8212478.1 GYDIA family GHMP kinase [Mariniflexile sp. KMM 9835]